MFNRIYAVTLFSWAEKIAFYRFRNRFEMCVRYRDRCRYSSRSGIQWRAVAGSVSAIQQFQGRFWVYVSSTFDLGSMSISAPVRIQYQILNCYRLRSNSGWGMESTSVTSPVCVQNQIYIRSDRYGYGIISRTGMDSISIPTTVWAQDLFQDHYEFGIRPGTRIGSGTIPLPLAISVTVLVWMQYQFQDRYGFSNISRFNISSRSVMSSEPDQY